MSPSSLSPRNFRYLRVTLTSIGVRMRALDAHTEPRAVCCCLEATSLVVSAPTAHERARDLCAAGSRLVQTMAALILACTSRFALIFGHRVFRHAKQSLHCCFSVANRNYELRVDVFLLFPQLLSTDCKA